MRRLACALLLLLPACLEYKIVVTTVVQPDGTFRRKLEIRAVDTNKHVTVNGRKLSDASKPANPWERFHRPAEPYKVEGDDEKGYTASVELKPGSHANGLRILLDDPTKDAPAAEGRVDVRAVNLLIGALYRYEERIALGTDPVKFREELPKWLDLSLRVLVEALKMKFPDIDFAQVEARARADLLPPIERAIVNLHHAATAMMLEIGPITPAAPPETILTSEFWPAIARELAAFGVELPKDEAALRAMLENEGEGLLRAVRDPLVDRLLAPLPEAKRADVRAALLSEDELEEEWDAAARKLYTGQLEEDLLAFATSAFGAYAIRGLFDTFDLRFRVELPGKLLRTNGDLSKAGAAWHIEPQILVPPILYAYSFVPSKGVPGDAWDLDRLGKIHEALKDLAPEARSEVEGAVARALIEGWKDEKGLSDEGKEACRLIREALEAAKTE